jgi:hypothetical protein
VGRLASNFVPKGHVQCNGYHPSRETPKGCTSGYSIAIYGIPRGIVNGDMRPSSVQVFQRDDGMAVVNEFPVSTGFQRAQTGNIEFDAQIGRIVVAQSFDPETMGFSKQAGT